MPAFENCLLLLTSCVHGDYKVSFSASVLTRHPLSLSFLMGVLYLKRPDIERRGLLVYLGGSSEFPVLATLRLTDTPNILPALRVQHLGQSDERRRLFDTGLAVTHFAL